MISCDVQLSRFTRAIHRAGSSKFSAVERSIDIQLLRVLLYSLNDSLTLDSRTVALHFVPAAVAEIGVLGTENYYVHSYQWRSLGNRVGNIQFPADRLATRVAGVNNAVL